MLNLNLSSQWPTGFTWSNTILTSSAKLFFSNVQCDFYKMAVGGTVHGVIKQD